MKKHPYHPHINIGRKGPLVFYERNDQLCVRTHTDPKNPQTEDQQTNRDMYGFLTKISSKTKMFRSFCFQDVETYHNSHTAFVGIQLMWLNPLKDQDQNQSIKELKWSLGKKQHPKWLEMKKQNNHTLTWEVTNGVLSLSDQRAQAMWIAYDCKNSSWIWDFNAGRRDNGSCVLDIPDNWGEEEWYLWLMFYNEKKKTVSRAARLIIPPGGESVKTNYPEQSRNTINEDLVIDCWLESRGLRGKELKYYLLDNQNNLEWRPWL